MTSMQPGFAAFRGPADREVFAPGFSVWLSLGAMLRGLWRAAIALPDRGRGTASDGLPPEYFRFPPF